VKPVQEYIVAQIADLDANNRQGRHDVRPGINQVFDTSLGERSTSELSARAVQRLSVLGEMTGGIAHDFRNILAIIESGLGLAERCSEQPEKMRVYIAAAREGIRRGVKLTSQLLTFAKQRELKARAGDANELLKNLEMFLKYGAGPRVRILLKLAPDIPKCLIDPPQFEAAVLNLVVNARDAMPNGGEVEISTERCVVKQALSSLPIPGTYVQVRIKDNGQGMPEEVLRQVFDPFFTTKGEKGTGLGLPHVLAFMQLIGGSVKVASEVGTGTTFDLLFPSVEGEGHRTNG
jgi:signal transduction histidine kinase